MTTFSEHQAAPNKNREEEARTGLKGFSTWRAVYLGVMIGFAVTVLAMWALKIHYA